MEELKTLINQNLENFLIDVKDGNVKEAMKYSLLSNGKRIRGISFLMVLKSYNINYRNYMAFACAIEMIHCYSLIHDDLPAMDNDDLRRGLPTCHNKFDEATAILAGDALLNRAYEIMLSSEIDDSLNIKLMNVLSSSSGQNGMIYGQQLDIYYENKKATLEELKDIHLYKTGKLFMAPLVMASIIANDEDRKNWEKIGKCIGRAFQIQDDILDVVGNNDKIGKATGSDEKLNKSTYTSILGLETSKELVNQYYTKAIELLYSLRINHGLILGLLENLIRREY